MKPKSKYRLWGVLHSLVQQLVAPGVLVSMAQFFLSPLVAWLFQDSSFSWSGLKKVTRLILLAVVFAFLAGLVVSYYQRATLTEDMAQDIAGWKPTIVVSGFFGNQDLPD